MKCRLCNSDVESVINLGSIYPSNFIKSVDDTKLYAKKPLNMVKCVYCDLVQIEENPELDSMYRQYWYKSSLNKSMVTALQDVVDNIEKRINLKDNDIVVDIGANDGTMLSQYSNKNLITIGFDPALNLREEAERKCTHYINDYFSADKYPSYIKANVISAIACFYDLPSPHDFVRDVVALLDQDGIFVIQFTDLLNTLMLNAFDNFVHEHIELYSFKLINQLMAEYGLEVFDAELNKVNGGSIRAYIGFKNVHEVKETVANLLKYEQDFMDQFDDPFKAFADRVDFIKRTTVDFITKEVACGKKIFISGASTKGNSLLQFFEIDSTLIKYAAEVNKDKFGLFTLGSNIEMIPEEEALKMNPDYFLILPWHFSSFFRKTYKDYLNKGGKFIIPCPEFKIIANSWEI